MIEPALLSRPSGLYRVDGLRVGDAPVSLTFPPSFELPELAGVTVAATVFAVRDDSSHPLWCEFKHPADGRWRSVFARREWTGAAPTEPPAVKRGPFKRPR